MKTSKISLISHVFILTAFSFITACGDDSLKIKVTNPLNQSRINETVSVNLAELPQAARFSTGEISVFSEQLEKVILSQAIDNDGDGKNDELIFQADFQANQSQTFRISPNGEADDVDLEVRTNAMFVPQRKDDFAWENDRIAFRMYGPELQRTEMTSSGIDVWVKRAKYPVMEKLYAKGDAYYHTDNDMGFDFYTVGKSLGCGGLGAWYENKVMQSENFVSWKIIANGPIRSIFELTYKPWNMGGKMSGETKRISIDLGSNFNRMQSRFDGDVSGATAAAGVVKNPGGGNALFGEDKTWLSYWHNPDPNNGSIGCAVILPKNAAKIDSATTENQNVLLIKLEDNNSITYYAGACWSKSPGFESEEKWLAHVKNKALVIENPLKVEVISE